MRGRASGGRRVRYVEAAPVEAFNVLACPAANSPPSLLNWNNAAWTSVNSHTPRRPGQRALNPECSR